ELVAVVVLHEKPPVTGGELQQRQPAGGREDHGGGELMVGGEVDRSKAGALGQRRERSDVDPLVVHRNRDDSSSGAPERGPGWRVANRLHCHGGSRLEKAAGEGVGVHPTAGTDEEGVLGGGKSASRGEHLRQRATQAWVAAKVSVSQQRWAVPSEHAAIGPSQLCGRNLSKVGCTLGENQHPGGELREPGNPSQPWPEREASPALPMGNEVPGRWHLRLGRQ